MAVLLTTTGASRSTVWAVSGALSAVAALVVVLGSVGAPVQAVVVFWFLLVCPGTTVLCLLEPMNALWHLLIGIAVSIALGVVVAQVLLFTGAWSPVAGLLVLAAVTCVAAGLQLTRSQWPLFGRA